MLSVEKTAKTKELAIEEALRELNTSKDNVIIEILEEEKEGLLGIFGARPARVRVTLKEDKTKTLVETSENILKLMGFSNLSVKLEKTNENQFLLQIYGSNLGNIIGKRGATLNALEHLLNTIINKDGENKILVTVDASGYRNARIKSLEELSLKLAAKVKETNKSIELEPMSSQERKIIHNTLKNNNDVYTYSKGEEPYRKVVISAKNKNNNNDDETIKLDNYKSKKNINSKNKTKNYKNTKSLKNNKDSKSNLNKNKTKTNNKSNNNNKTFNENKSLKSKNKNVSFKNTKNTKNTKSQSKRSNINQRSSNTSQNINVPKVINTAVNNLVKSKENKLTNNTVESTTI